MADTNEVVVNLPKSVFDSSQRLSFVVFRNDRAFHSSEGLFAVNSRVLSVKVGNVTQFNNGEVIYFNYSNNVIIVLSVAFIAFLSQIIRP